MLPIAFAAAKQAMRDRSASIDRLVRVSAAETFNKLQVVAKLIDHIKTLIGPPELAAAAVSNATAAECETVQPAGKGG